MASLNLSKIKATLSRVPDQFDGIVAQVGFPAGPAYEDGTTVAYVAVIQEFGAPEQNIPPRPFMRPTVADRKGAWVRIMKSMVPRVIHGQGTADEALDTVGTQAAEDIKKTITRIYSPPLKESTIMARYYRKTKGLKRKGPPASADTKPLIDTDTLHATVQATVNKAGAPFVAKES